MEDRYSKFRKVLYNYLEDTGYKMTPDRHEAIKELLVGYIKTRTRNLLIKVKEQANTIENYKNRKNHKQSEKHHQEALNIYKEADDTAKKVFDNF